MVVIPAIDIIDGKLVRLSQGDYSTKMDYGLSPVDAAKSFEDGGLSHLHIVDLDAAKGSGDNLKVLEKIASAVSLEIDFGGGIRSEESIRRALSAGADKVNIGSAAVKDRSAVESWAGMFPSCIILSADCRSGMIAVSGWTEDTGIPIIPFLSSYALHGVDTAAVTDISRDGMLSGPSAELYGNIIQAIPSIRLIASGGISSKDDLEKLRALGCHGAIVGKAYYEGRISICEMKEAEC